MSLNAHVEEFQEGDNSCTAITGIGSTDQGASWCADVVVERLVKILFRLRM